MVRSFFQPGRNTEIRNGCFGCLQSHCEVVFGNEIIALTKASREVPPRMSRGMTLKRQELREIPTSEVRVGRIWRSRGSVAWLKESIVEHGLLHPISVTAELQLIAGWHRLQAFRELGRETIPAFVLGVDALEAGMLAIDENLVRNELTALERADLLRERKGLYEALHPDTRRGGDRGNQYTGGKKRQTAVSAFCQEARIWTGQSTRTVRHYIQVSSRLCPEAKALIRRSRIENSITDLSQISRLPEPEQVRVIQILIRETRGTVRQAITECKREQYRASSGNFSNTTQIHFLEGDFREVGKVIDVGSAKMVITDPPFSNDAVTLFDSLGAFSSEVLQPGGSLFCMVPPSNLPEVIAALGRHLKYQWTYVYVQGGPGKIVYSRRICNGQKLILWFVKDRYEGSPFTDVIFGTGPDKRFHPWGQSETAFDLLINRYTESGDLVIDPFLGGGATAAAAFDLNRRFIGIDVSPAAIETVRCRIGQRMVNRDVAGDALV